MNIEVSPKQYEQELNWNDAMLYCQLLVIDDKNDWRLPTLEELKEIYTSENDFDGSTYWASTDFTSYYTFTLNLSSGYQNFNGKHNSFYVRAVRSLNL